MKRGVLNNLFVYLFTVVVIAALFMFGYQAITNFMGRAEDVALVQFQKKLQDDISILSLEIGSVRTIEYRTPSAVQVVCFVESYPEIPAQKVLNIPYPIIADSVKSNVRRNVFLIEEQVGDSMYVGDISITEGEDPPHVLCIPTTGGSIELRLTGKGNHVLVEQN